MMIGLRFASDRMRFRSSGQASNDHLFRTPGLVRRANLRPPGASTVCLKTTKAMAHADEGDSRFLQMLTSKADTNDQRRDRPTAWRESHEPARDRRSPTERQGST
jgi:hypothetical protein